MGRNDVVAVVAPVWSDKLGRHEALALLDMGEWDVDSTLLCPMSELHGLFIAGPQAFRRPCPVVVSFRVGGVGDCCRRGRLFESFVGESGVVVCGCVGVVLGARRTVCLLRAASCPMRHAGARGLAGVTTF